MHKHSSGFNKENTDTFKRLQPPFFAAASSQMCSLDIYRLCLVHREAKMDSRFKISGSIIDLILWDRSFQYKSITESNRDKWREIERDGRKMSVGGRGERG